MTRARARLGFRRRLALGMIALRERSNPGRSLDGDVSGLARAEVAKRPLPAADGIPTELSPAAAPLLVRRADALGVVGDRAHSVRVVGEAGLDAERPGSCGLPTDQVDVEADIAVTEIRSGRCMGVGPEKATVERHFASREVVDRIGGRRWVVRVPSLQLRDDLDGESHVEQCTLVRAAVGNSTLSPRARAQAASNRAASASTARM